MSKVSDFLTKRRYMIPSIFIVIMLITGVALAASVDNSNYEAVVQSSQFIGTSTVAVLSSAPAASPYTVHSYNEGTLTSGGIGAFYNNVSVLAPNVNGENSFIDTEKALIMERGHASTEESMYMSMIGLADAGGDSKQMVCRDVFFENSFRVSSIQMASSIDSSAGFTSDPYMLANVEAIGFGHGSVISGFKTLSGIGNTTTFVSMSGTMHKVDFGGEFATKVAFDWNAVSRIPQGINVPDIPSICPLN